MKVFILSILLVISVHVLGQAKKLNKLFQQYTLSLHNTTDFQLPQSLPIALQDSKELIVPYDFGNGLFLVKWKNIDSVHISEFRNGSIVVTIFGKFTQYTKSTSTNTHTVRYCDTRYSIEKTTYLGVHITLGSKIDSVKLSRSMKFRKQIRNVFCQLNNSHITENYIPLPPPNASVEYDSVTNSIVRYQNYAEDKKNVLFAKDLQHAKAIKLVYEIDLKVVGFTFYLSNKEELIGQFSNQGATFNDEILKQLNKLQPGTSFTFDDVKVTDLNGKIRTITGWGFIAQ